MTREEFIEQYLKPLLVEMEQGKRILLVDPEEYKQLKIWWNFTDEDVWGKDDPAVR